MIKGQKVMTQTMPAIYLKFNILQVSLRPNVVEIGGLSSEISQGVHRLAHILTDTKNEDFNTAIEIEKPGSYNIDFILNYTFFDTSLIKFALVKVLEHISKS